MTDVGGNRDVLGPRLQYRLIQSGAAGGLVMAWLEALSDPQKRDQDGEAARQRIHESFSLPKMVRRYRVKDFLRNAEAAP